MRCFLETLPAFVGVLAAFMKVLVTTFSVSLASMGFGASKRNGFWVIVWASLSLGAETHETIDTSAGPVCRGALPLDACIRRLPTDG